MHGCCSIQYRIERTIPMKKFVSLFLILALALGLTCGTTLAADLKEVDEAVAGVKLVSGDGPARFYETFSSALLEVAVKDSKTPVITVLKDLELTSTGAVMHTPTAGGQWNGGNGGNDRLTIDLNGHTLNYTGTGYIFNAYRWGAIIENGTIIYNNTSEQGGSPIWISTPTFRTALTSGSSVWGTKVTLRNLDVYNVSAGGGAVVASYVHNATVTASNCTLYSAKGPAIYMGKTDQSDIGEGGKPWTGAYTPKVNVTSSKIVSGSTYPLQFADAGVTVSSMEAVYVTNTADGKIAATSPAYTADFGGQTAETQKDWTMKLPAGTASGTAVAYGAAVLPELTAETAQGLYDQGIISAVILNLMLGK